MHLDKIKGTLVDFNELEHVLDDAPECWRVADRIAQDHDDPLELDELILHVQRQWRGLKPAEPRPLRALHHALEIHPTASFSTPPTKSGNCKESENCSRRKKWRTIGASRSERDGCWRERKRCEYSF